MPKKKSKPEEVKVDVVEVECSVCSDIIKMTKQEFENETFFDQYIIRAGDMAAIQLGPLCSLCFQKELKDRIVYK